VGKVRDRAPDEWDCVVFMAVVEAGTRQRAVRLLADRYDEHITVEGVRSILIKINRWLGRPALREGVGPRGKAELTIRGRRFHRFCERVRGLYQEERRCLVESDVTRLVCLPHHATIVKTLYVETLAQNPPGEEKIGIEELQQSDRGNESFLDQAFWPLTTGTYHLAIGQPPPAEFKDELQSDLLYESQLEVLVPAEHPHDAMTLTEFVRWMSHVPPKDSRARSLLEAAIAEHRIDDPGEERRVASETYEVGSVIERVALLHECGLPGPLVLAPSDIALIYKPGMRFGGAGVEHSKWIPLHHRGARLTLEVHVTTANPRPNHLRPIVALLQKICADQPRLRGEPFRDQGVPQVVRTT
jgi:DNA-binding transcriptional LysR family regulator